MHWDVNETVFGVFLGALGVAIGIFGTRGIINDKYMDSTGLKIGLIVLICLIALSLIVGGIFLIRGDKKRKQNAEKRKNNGVDIYADFDEVNIILNNGGINDSSSQSYYTIKCSWVNPDDNKLYYFKSDALYHNPEKLIAEKNIQKFKVTYENGNIKNYEVDISEVEECK